MFYTVYKTTNLVNGNFYLGCHKACIMRLAFFVLLATLAQASTPAAPRAAREYRHQVRQQLQVHNMDDVSCEYMAEAEAKSTPAPLLSGPGPVKVSFIILPNGIVESPLVLESQDPQADREAMRAVLAWRFHPAMCNYVPLPAEGIVTFF